MIVQALSLKVVSVSWLRGVDYSVLINFGFDDQRLDTPTGPLLITLHEYAMYAHVSLLFSPLPFYHLSMPHSGLRFCLRICSIAKITVCVCV
jgi:hypothetical protein